MRGFGAGLIWGGVLGLAGLATASQIAPLPATRVAAPAVAVPAASEFARPLPETRPVPPADSPAPLAGAAPAVAVPDAAKGAGAAVPLPDTSPALRPVSAPAAPAAPAMPAAATAADEPVLRASSAPVAPAPARPKVTPPAPEAPPPAAASAPPPRLADTPRAEVGEAPEIDALTRPPIERFARPFANPDGRPTFAILLIDDGAPGLDRAALARLPFPVSFALDPRAPDVAAQAAIYRSAGQELVVLAEGIPPAATAAEAEASLAALAAAVPEAVAVLDLPEGGFQTNRPLATQMVPILAAQGRGLISWDRGLNAADQVASRAGLPAAVVFRRFDAGGDDTGGGDAAAMRHALDRAVFRAGQQGQVVVAGQASAGTMAALLEWAVEGRAAAVALAPVTAVMTAR